MQINFHPLCLLEHGIFVNTEIIDLNQTENLNSQQLQNIGFLYNEK